MDSKWTPPFMPLLLSQGALLAGLIANHIFYEGKTLRDFKPEIVAAVVFFLYSRLVESYFVVD